MATYKVPQDVEAEDKLLGPLTFKQLIFLLIAGFLFFIMFMLAKVNIVLIVIPLPFFLVFLFFGVYRRKDQSVETYVAAILRFYFKPRKRTWDQDGLSENVVITAPKKIEAPTSVHLSRHEVQNRLSVLGNLMDTRGWSSKNANLQDAGTATMAMAASDRLVQPIITQETSEVSQADDIFDMKANESSQKLSELTDHMQDDLQAAAKKMADSAAGGDNDLPDLSSVKYKARPTMHENVLQPLSQSDDPAASDDSTISDDMDDQAKDAKSKKDKTKDKSTTNSAENDDAPSPKSEDNDKSNSTMTTEVSPDILTLSNNNDRTVESIAREADEILESGDTISLRG